MCSTCLPPQGIIHCRSVTNPATECPAMFLAALGGSHHSIPIDWMDGIDISEISNIPRAKKSASVRSGDRRGSFIPILDIIPDSESVQQKHGQLSIALKSSWVTTVNEV
ncbi:hypothetical protein NPIL_118561 [Nephila pilipes]|uniref:Uncharacterized protein n=1 Tax=Nephila pilipes TaxID=299642 RepID=A0A8X6PVC9_NEPPI|nr:hypothetical protein NPIL_118561 [Nephila pilipes]